MPRGMAKKGGKPPNQSQASLRLVGVCGCSRGARLSRPALSPQRSHHTIVSLASQSPQHPLGRGCGCLSNTPQAHPRPQARVSFSLPSLLKPPDSQIFALQPVPPPKPSGPACLIRAPSNAPQDSSGKAVTLSPSIQCEGKRPLPEPAFATFSGPFQR